jgi:hypothetical protein
VQHNNEPSGSIKKAGYSDNLSDNQRFK